MKIFSTDCIPIQNLRMPNFSQVSKNLEIQGLLNKDLSHSQNLKHLSLNLCSKTSIKSLYVSGLEKNLNSSLPFGQVALKFCLPWASFRLLFLQFSWQMNCLGLGQVRMKSDLPNRKIYLSRTTGQHFFRALCFK